MQQKFNSDDELAKLNLQVRDVVLVQKTGNEYKGLATVRTQKGTEREVPVEVTFDGDNILWESPPGALLFALEEAERPAVAPPPPAPPRATAPSVSAVLNPSRGGLVYIVTKSGKTRCQVSATEVSCQSPFIDPPYVNGYPANGMTFYADGTLQYVSGDLGDIPVVPIDYATYRALSWTIDATSDGTTFTHTGTGRSVFISVTSVQVR
ncbi:hypothetical protein [Mycolicibacterium parafortuitum]|uniref:hypothetical protein n=1 Tax=Mycolicibacterium parafortuitum TaxID=39692 RepID=UPI0032C48D50